MIVCPPRAPFACHVAPWIASDAVNPISPRLRDPQQRPRKGSSPRTPESERELDEEPRQAPPAQPPTRDASEDEATPHIDVVVTGIPLPTGQILPSSAFASCVH